MKTNDCDVMKKLFVPLFLLLSDRIRWTSFAAPSDWKCNFNRKANWTNAQMLIAIDG